MNPDDVYDKEFPLGGSSDEQEQEQERKEQPEQEQQQEIPIVTEEDIDFVIETIAKEAP
jgi:hypothetical protein